LTLFESGAMLLYLADKSKFLTASHRTGAKRAFSGCSGKRRTRSDGGQTIISGTSAPEKLPYAINCYVNETARP
jgi:GST-like protein